MTSQSQFQSSQNMSALLAECGKIAPDAEKSFGPRQTAEATRDLLLDFDHANISLGKVIGKGYGEVFQEAEHSVLANAESIKQIASGTCLRRPGLLGASTLEDRRISQVPFLAAAPRIELSNRPPRWG